MLNITTEPKKVVASELLTTSLGDELKISDIRFSRYLHFSFVEAWGGRQVNE
jgi:hypothetical protein